MGDQNSRCQRCGVPFVAASITRGVQGRPTVCPGCAALGRITGPRSGEIKWYDRRRGYGLIADDNGGTVFVHVSAVKAQRRRLRKGNRLSYLVEITEHGEQACRVQMAPSGREAG